MMTNIFDWKFYVFLHLFTIFCIKCIHFAKHYLLSKMADGQEWQTVYLTQGPI